MFKLNASIQVVCLAAFGVLAISAQASTIDNLVHIKNNSGFYIFTKNDSPSDLCFYTDNAGKQGQPISMIKPGQEAFINPQFCGGGNMACATSDYSTDPSQGGCMEGANPTASSPISKPTQGGYASWFSFTGGVQAPKCNIDPNVHWSCSLDNSANDQGVKDLTFSYHDVTQRDAGGNVVKLSTPQSYTSGPEMRGVNISAMEYDGTYLDAMFQIPDLPEMVDFTKQGMNTVRFPVRAEFLFGKTGNEVESPSANPAASGISPNLQYIEAIHNIASKYLKSGLHVDLDLHNYMRFCKAGASIGQMNEPTNNQAVPAQLVCNVMTSQQLASIWNVLMTTKDSNGVSFASLAKAYPNTLVFELMNEPYSQKVSAMPHQIVKTETVLANEVAAAKAIRATGVNNLILFSGNYWDPLHDWTTGNPDTKDMGLTPNGAVFTQQTLAGLGNVGVDVHQYFDQNYSGLSQTCIPKDQFLQGLALDKFTAWMKANHMKVFLGEFGSADNPACESDMKDLLDYVYSNAYSSKTGYGFVGWTGWRVNRHGDSSVGFNFLQQSSPLYYTKINDQIKQGQANGLITNVFIKDGFITPLN